MRVESVALPGILLITPRVFEDERGFFFEAYQANNYAKHGIQGPMVQDNVSRSRKGVLRGLHYQIMQPQGKLVSVLRGEIFDVTVDLRRSSPAFGRWFGVTLRADEFRQLWIPKGFAHGFLVLSDWAEVTYKVNDQYCPTSERTLIWNDPTINVAWPSLEEGSAPILSIKDAQGLRFTESELFG